MTLQKLEIVICFADSYFSALSLISVNKLLVVPPRHPEDIIFCQELKHWSDRKDQHNTNDLPSNISVPLCSKIRMLSSKQEKCIKQFIIHEFNQIHPNYQRKNNHIYEEAEENRKAAPTVYCSFRVKADEEDNRLGHDIEEIIIDQNDQRCNKVVASTEFLILDVV